MMDFATACTLYLAYASTTYFFVLVETDKTHVAIGHIRITLDFLLTYCYVGKDSDGNDALRFKPGKAAGRAIMALMDDPVEMLIKDYTPMVAGFSTYINKKGEVKRANRGDKFERYVFEVLYQLTGWQHSTRAHIYGGDIPADRVPGLDEDIEVKTCYNSTFMTLATYNELMERANN